MDVLGLSLSHEITASVRDGAAELGLSYRQLGEVSEAAEYPVALAMFREFSDAAAIERLGQDELPAWERHDIAVLRQWSGPATFTAVRRGFALVVDGGLTSSRVAKTLTYLRRVAPPNASRTVLLDTESGQARAVGEGSTTLTGEQVQLLARLAERPGGILARSEIERIGEENPSALVSSLAQRLEEAGSQVRILKVPHIGYRLVGSVRMESL